MSPESSPTPPKASHDVSEPVADPIEHSADVSRHVTDPIERPADVSRHVANVSARVNVPT